MSTPAAASFVACAGVNSPRHAQTFRLYCSFIFGTTAQTKSTSLSEGPRAEITIQKVFDSYLLGNYADTVKVKPATYDFSNGYISNLNGKAFVMVGTGGAAQTIFDADGKNSHFYISISSEDAIVFDGITFKNGNHNQNNGGAVTIYGSVTVDFRNSHFEKNTSVLYLNSSLMVSASHFS